ncbi:MAG: glutamine--fructose-6-phosphate transaminase (isomerizing) [Methanolinea sp.]|nr:glutamine--fructose-6-phosphate transaminase (isomerizing) [Methanolinea sp.]
MCGIFGYCGKSGAAPILIKGLKRLEYRGYDSYGIAVLNKEIQVVKHVGRIGKNTPSMKGFPGKIGIGHTRWATHGAPSDRNAHPHMDCQEKIAVVHNGIIENYAALRRELQARGHNLRSETDTEVIPHLLEEHYHGDLLAAVEEILPMLEGSYAILALACDENRIIAARKSSPLVLGMGDREFLVASDMTPILEYTERVVILEDGDVAILSNEGVIIRNQGEPVERSPQIIDWTLEEVRKGGFAHYMQKEIFDQPQAYSDTLRALRKEEIPPALLGIRGITIVACGTSFHAGVLARYLVEQYCGIPARLELASEFKYFTPPLSDLVIGITQSGETADTLAAIKAAKMFNCPTLAITNVLGSTVTRLADHTLYMRAGPEISVAATKSFIAELAVFFHLIDSFSGGALTESLDKANRSTEDALMLDLSEAVRACQNARSMFFVGRGPFYALALEGALKMKEISYIHAEGYAAGEIKHGPFALLSEETPVVALCPPGPAYPVMISNIKEMKARGAPMIAIGEAGDADLREIADVFVPLPAGDQIGQILATTIVLQLLAYHTADALGRDVDRPRNLAKSVTVE